MDSFVATGAEFGVVGNGIENWISRWLGVVVSVKRLNSLMFWV